MQSERGERGEVEQAATEERVLQRGNPDSDAAVVLLWGWVEGAETLRRVRCRIGSWRRGLNDN